jgi:hypothetical protein
MVRAIEIGVAQAAEIAKPSAMEHTGGFAFVPQDRAVSPTQHRQGYQPDEESIAPARSPSSRFFEQKQQSRLTVRLMTRSG